MSVYAPARLQMLPVTQNDSHAVNDQHQQTCGSLNLRICTGSFLIRQGSSATRGTAVCWIPKNAVPVTGCGCAPQMKRDMTTAGMR